MRAVSLLFLPLCVLLLSGFDDVRQLSVPTAGTPDDRIAALWQQTRPLLIADAGQPLTDAESLARGAPLVEAWTELQASLAATDASGEVHAVLKLLNDMYGRPEAKPERRVATRNETRRDFGQRLATVESRLNR
ncbi:MAG TPA: hypothetical protein VIS76_15175 [Pseudomonadales bacterium]